MNTYLRQRLESKVIRITESGCWVFTDALNHAGYGWFRINGKSRYAHRIAYEEFVGPIPEGLQLDHLCKVRCCINPNHLEPVTCKENLRRSTIYDKNRNKTHCKYGHEFTPENTYIKQNGCRLCKTCSRTKPWKNTLEEWADE